MMAAEEHDLGDAGLIRAILIHAARERRVISYSELLGRLGYRFSRTKMRVLCRTLGAIDQAGEVAEEPPLAVLVVRGSDRLPGRGWWIGREGPQATSPDAASYVAELQGATFAFWCGAVTGRVMLAVDNSTRDYSL
ncbi:MULTISPECIES: ribose-phosphate pyrophosphokinase [unclassified Sphingomonas]|uniref:ribose-phosphate pyrophosphokinase n=1 Tax=unclassified Sphingomonas TaxID=196159 RepID=UPI00226AE90F|nr:MULTISPECIES: ribose-phosphate pyrophosphokinase [unclassified Sphingomonas]